MAQHLKVVMAQLDLIVGDIDSNTELLLSSARRAIAEFEADLIAFPELTLTGYPPEDLLLRPSLQPRISHAIDQILAADLNIYLVFGHPLKEGDSLFNALSIIKGGKLLATYRKQCLPNYLVFDERRYFDAGSEPLVMEIAGSNIAFNICEDMWESAPIELVKSRCADLLININASPFSINKLSERQRLLKQQSIKGGFPIIYVNLVGGQDELVFDGGSMAIAATGECKYLAPRFEEGLYLVDIGLEKKDEDSTRHASSSLTIDSYNIAPPMSMEAEVYSSLVIGVRDYVEKNKFSGVVLGLSGGIDSALTLAIAVDALGAARVHAVMMPFEFTSQLSLDAAAEQANTLAVNYQVIPISNIYNAFIESLKVEFNETQVDVSEQNIQARCRGVLLMAISNKKGYLVLTTGNKSEIAVGYSTLYGDMAGGFDVLKDVAKSLVYRLATYRNREYVAEVREAVPQQVIDRPPSAELAADQIDQDSLPPYDILDEILEMYVEKDFSAVDIIAAGFDELVVKKVLRLVDLNEHKRRQSPIGVRLTQRGFGRDRRYPITNAWPLGE
ncbi:MAG TPA: NAD+ synthase [Porticoccaceae bacterium]|jgi:NAD+ synthase (glutamine-hydrolysing)|nr:NAD+ synthase [Gammaproteobacteria bacterium]HIL61804.1 NAD+ synthase [Porticoccaceae bacterium]